jgi:FkbM family methyltransferase
VPGKEAARMDYLTYDIEGISVLIPDEHLLPVYQNTHPLYDRFPKFLVKHLPENSEVVEVGANVGDTLTSMVSTRRMLRYLCVEGDDLFFDYLQLNKAILERFQDHSRIIIDIEKSFVAAELQYSSFTGSGGTRSGDLYRPLVGNSSSYIPTQTLDAIVERYALRNISLIMSDVDGYDYDIILSAWRTIKRQKPLIYFELTPRNDEAIKAYLRVIKKLKDLKYTSFYVFDNFGNYIFNCPSLDSMRELCDYVIRQNSNLGTRTIYYFDVLAVPRSKQNLGERVIEDFINANFE